MSCRNLVLILGFSLILHGCAKHQPFALRAGESPLVQAAHQYFADSVLVSALPRASYRAGIARTVYWDQAEAVKLPIGEGVVVPLHYAQPLFVKPSFAGDHLFNLDNLSQLLVYRDQQANWHAEVLTWLPDSNLVNQPTNLFTGYLFVEDWQGNTLSKWFYTGGKVLKYHEPSKQVLGFVTICTYIIGYNYSRSNANDGYAWVESAGCTMAYEPDTFDYGTGGGGTGGRGLGGGGALNLSVVPIRVLSGTNRIANISDYFKCFTNVGGSDHIYTVTVCVDQPEPGTRTPWTAQSGGLSGSSDAGNVVDVGHTFLIFSEQYGTTTVTRNMGFYPSGGVNPAYPSSQGMLNNDEGHTYNISATFTVTNAQFFTMLNFGSRGNSVGFLYNLNNENCTTYALQTLMQGGVSLPSTIGSWVNGMGNNPGDLGEDLRQMALQPNMSRNTVESYHPNQGNCQ